MTDFPTLDYEAVQSEKRDRINARLQVWSLLVALIGGFGLASLQSGTVSYVVALYPLLATCIARYTGHSEHVLDQIKTYLLTIEQNNSFPGYESFNRDCARKSSGGHKKALRDALLLTEALATGTVVVRLWIDHTPILAVLITMIEIVATAATSRYLREGGKAQ